jgi:DNA-binding transcriptional MerR regulator
MTYSVKKLARLANVSVRTLHYYDTIGLLTPKRVAGNNYREYGEAELLKLQQILFFRELDFPLEEIKRILNEPGFDMLAALRDQKRLIEMRKNRLLNLMKTIERTMKKIQNETTMEDKELYGNFSKEEMDEYAREAKARWGNTEAYKESQERTKNWTKEDYARVAKAGDELMKKIASHMALGAASPEVQALIAEHYNSLRTFYEPNLEMYVGLANMYVDDPRFRATFERYDKDLPQFMRDAMLAYVEKQKTGK